MFNMKRILFIVVLVFGIIATSFAQSAKFTSQNNEEFAAIIGKKKTQIVDVRTPAEYEKGHIANAININVQSKDFDEQIAQLKKKRPVAVYCRSGRRSKVAAQKLANKGYIVYELDKGIMHWKGELVK